MTSNPNYDSWLQEFIRAQKGIAGTVHLLEGGILRLTAAHNIPPPVCNAVATVPRGKGMAGLALEREKPVQTCNLQTDTSGDVRPGARAVNAQAAVALPVFDGEQQVRAVIGIAFPFERDLSPDEIHALENAASALPT